MENGKTKRVNEEEALVFFETSTRVCSERHQQRNARRAFGKKPPAGLMPPSGSWSIQTSCLAQKRWSALLPLPPARRSQQAQNARAPVRGAGCDPSQRSAASDIVTAPAAQCCLFQRQRIKCHEPWAVWMHYGVSQQFPMRSGRQTASVGLDIDVTVRRWPKSSRRSRAIEGSACASAAAKARHVYPPRMRRIQRPKWPGSLKFSATVSNGS